MTIQDALSANQNWTVLGILAVVLLGVISLLVWVVKWLCTRFASSVDKCSEVVGEGTKANLQIASELNGLKQTTNDLRDRFDKLPGATADELQRRKIG